MNGTRSGVKDDEISRYTCHCKNIAERTHMKPLAALKTEDGSGASNERVGTDFQSTY